MANQNAISGWPFFLPSYPNVHKKKSRQNLAALVARTGIEPVSPP